MRGEHVVPLITQYVKKGSSPHARGAPHHRDAAVEQVGIIPACAGSTVTEKVKGEWSEDHPRMRGEHQRTHTARRRRCGPFGTPRIWESARGVRR